MPLKSRILGCTVSAELMLVCAIRCRLQMLPVTLKAVKTTQTCLDILLLVQVCNRALSPCHFGAIKQVQRRLGSAAIFMSALLYCVNYQLRHIVTEHPLLRRRQQRTFWLKTCFWCPLVQGHHLLHARSFSHTKGAHLRTPQSNSFGWNRTSDPLLWSDSAHLCTTVCLCMNQWKYFPTMLCISETSLLGVGWNSSLLWNSRIVGYEGASASGE